MNGYITAYTNDHDRYELDLVNGTIIELHCGDTFEIELHHQWIFVHIEMNQNGWYLAGNQTSYDMPLHITKIRFNN